MILLKKPYLPLIFTGESKSFSVYGKSFFKVTNVYLSGLPYSNTTLFNPFSSVPRLSALYPEFYAIKLPTTAYTSNNDNTVTFTMPSASSGGFVDIIVENQAGYGALTRYAIKSTYNPYVSGTAEYEAYQPYIRPWSQGVLVVRDEVMYSLDSYTQLVTISGENIVGIQP
jgi:hypothetical protein